MMARYIDADAYAFPGDLIDEPTADVVEVVRCKDCVDWEEYPEESNAEQLGGCSQFICDTTCDAFCSYGKRKEGAEK